MKTAFLMVKEHGYNWADIENMFPFEYEIQVILILEHLEHIKRMKGK